MSAHLMQFLPRDHDVAVRLGRHLQCRTCNLLLDNVGQVMIDHWVRRGQLTRQGDDYIHRHPFFVIPMSLRSLLPPDAEKIYPSTLWE